MINLPEIYWPISFVLPYLGHRTEQPSIENKKKNAQKMSKNISHFNLNCSEEGFEGDVKLVGKLIEHLMTSSR